MSTLDNFMTQEQKQEVKEEKEFVAKNILLKYSLTKETLVDKFGKAVSDRILYKALKFVEYNCYRKISEKQEGNAIKQLWVCDPIPGYNITPYGITITYRGDDVHICCNCQYAMYDRLCSHDLGLVIKLNMMTQVITTTGGIRDGYKRTGKSNIAV